MLGEHLFSLISHMQSKLAGEITGMFLGMDNIDLLHVLELQEPIKAEVYSRFRISSK